MTDYIVFSVKSNQYAIDIEKIKRIIPVPKVTPLPNSHVLIEGMISYEEQVIEIVDFRALVSLLPFEEELLKQFQELKQQHQFWINSLESCVHENSVFDLTTDPHQCELGKWIDNFTSYDQHVSHILHDLDAHHKLLHHGGASVVEHCDDKEKAQKIFQIEVSENFTHTMHDIELFMAEFEIVAASLQKLLIYQDGDTLFAIKVDKIVDIVHLEDTTLQQVQNHSKSNEFLELEGVLEINDALVNLIASVTLPV